MIIEFFILCFSSFFFFSFPDHFFPLDIFFSVRLAMHRTRDFTYTVHGTLHGTVRRPVHTPYEHRTRRTERPPSEVRSFGNALEVALRYAIQSTAQLSTIAISLASLMCLQAARSGKSASYSTESLASSAAAPSSAGPRCVSGGGKRTSGPGPELTLPPAAGPARRWRLASLRKSSVACEGVVSCE